MKNIPDINATGFKEYLATMGFKDVKTVHADLLSIVKNGLASKTTKILELASISAAPDEAIINLERIISSTTTEAAQNCLKDDDNLSRLITLCAASPFLSNVIAQNPVYLEKNLLLGELKTEKEFGVFVRELSDWSIACDSYEDVSAVLRKYRNKELLRIGWRDLVGLSKMEITAKEVSDLAAASLEIAVRFAGNKLKEQYGRPLYKNTDGTEQEACFTVLGLGKLGGRELNYSSDIDIVYVYSSDDGETTGIEGKKDSRLALHEYFVKLAERVTKLINEVTSEGFVFRVDLDLRPEGKSGAIANSLRSMEIYYESWGRTWERSAMIKARAVAGDSELGKKFIKMITPFIYRKYLDFTSIEEIKTMKEKIDVNLLLRRPDAVDVKLGAGGIREIEFFTQALQLIYGGKEIDIREQNTLSALTKLSKHKLLKIEEEKILKENYEFLRNLEHRIQMVNLRQTQAIPAGDDEIKRLAVSMGLGSQENLWHEYKNRSSLVHSVYKTLFYASEDALKKSASNDAMLALSDETGEEEANAILKKLGFKTTEVKSAAIRALKKGAPHVNMPSRAGEILYKIGPVILSKAAKCADPDLCLLNMERFISSVGGRTAVYAMMSENPKLIEDLLKIFAFSAFLSNALIERPDHLELLLSAEMSKPRKTRLEMEKEIDDALKTAKDYEDRLNTLRRIRNREIFRIGINDILGEIETEDVSSQITAFAEASLEAAINLSIVELKEKYGKPTNDFFSILAMGKFAGKELIYGSDLDIVFVYDESVADTPTSGPKQITSHEYYAKLAQKIISVLSLRTSFGIVFAMDTRLRPSGSSGTLVVTKEALLTYQKEKAGTWERQAAIKSRAAAGNAAFGKIITEEMHELIYSRGITKEDAQEMLRIRKRMEEEIAKENDLTVDLKTGKGGLVDIEFLVQALQLKHGGKTPELRNPHTLKAITRLSEKNILDKKDAQFLTGAYAFIRFIETRLRITQDSAASVLKKDSAELEILAKKSGFDGSSALWEEYAKKSKTVRKIYLKTLESI